jgi:hypothetical protein
MFARILCSFACFLLLFFLTPTSNYTPWTRGAHKAHVARRGVASSNGQQPRPTMRTYTGTDADYPDIPDFVAIRTDPNVGLAIPRRQADKPFRRAELPDRNLHPIDSRSPGFLRAPMKKLKETAANFTTSGPLNATVVTREPSSSRALMVRSSEPEGVGHLADYIGSGYLLQCRFPIPRSHIFPRKGRHLDQQNGKRGGHTLAVDLYCESQPC